MAIDKASKAGVRPLASAEPTSQPAPAAQPAKTSGPVMQSAPELPGLAPDLVARRLKMGRDAENGIESQPIASKPPTYFRTYDQVKARLIELAKANPQLTKLIDIGDTFEKSTGKADRDMLVLKLTSPKNAGPKPKVFFWGGQHAREIANPEIMMRYIEWLISGYGKDPEATALLDTREIHILPMMNPDGHAVVERGYSGGPGGDLMKRKNTSGSGGQGTDLNRNWAMKNWGTAGVSHSQSSDTYCGPKAASELEVQAMQNYIDQEKFALSIDMHSYSELVLHLPDDNRKNTTPDHEHFVRVAKKFASYNGYTPQPAIDLYATSGSSFYAYEKQKTAAFVIETGTAFHQTDAQFEETWKKNFPVLKYATSIADDWKKASAGPEAQAAISAAGLLNVVAKDALTGAPAVAAEYTVDPMAKPGTGVKLAGTRADGNFLASRVTAQQLTGGKRQLVYVRAQNAAGEWGPATAVWLPRPTPQTKGVVGLRASQVQA